MKNETEKKHDEEKEKNMKKKRSIVSLRDNNKKGTENSRVYLNTKKKI